LQTRIISLAAALVDMTMLTGITFSRQIGSFHDAWLGGNLLDRLVSYDPI
jgi:hypothetical protein